MVLQKDIFTTRMVLQRTGTQNVQVTIPGAPLRCQRKIWKSNNCDVKLHVSYSSGLLEFDIPANSTLSLTQENAGVLTDSATEKAYGNLMHVVDCQFSHLYPYDPDYGNGYTQASNWTTIWEADEL